MIINDIGILFFGASTSSPLKKHVRFKDLFHLEYTFKITYIHFIFIHIYS